MKADKVGRPIKEGLDFVQFSKALRLVALAQSDVVPREETFRLAMDAQAWKGAGHRPLSPPKIKSLSRWSTSPPYLDSKPLALLHRQLSLEGSHGLAIRHNVMLLPLCLRWVREFAQDDRLACLQRESGRESVCPCLHLTISPGGSRHRQLGRPARPVRAASFRQPGEPPIRNEPPRLAPGRGWSSATPAAKTPGRM